MVDSVSREVILPALRLDVPNRPTDREVTALTPASSADWTVTPRTWVGHQVVRLAVAEVLRSRLEQAASTTHERHTLPADVGETTLSQLVAWFRPHADLAGQAFRIGLLEAVNARVPAALEPVREGLRRVGVTGRDPIKMVALGLDKIPERARGDFWASVRSAPALTALVDALAGGTHARTDLSALDRSHLARADAVVLGGGRATALAFDGRRPQTGTSWLEVPVRVSRSDRGRPGEETRRGAESGVEVSLRSASWVEVFETALDAVSAAMRQIDGAGRSPGRTSPLADALTQRLAAARDRRVGDICDSLRAIDPLALEMFDHQVTTSVVRVAVPVIEDDAFLQLWMPTSALAGPLFVGAADLFLGAGSDVRSGRPQGAGRPNSRPKSRPAGQTERGQTERGQTEGGQKRRSGRRGGQGRSSATPASTPPPATPPPATPPASPAGE